MALLALAISGPAFAKKKKGGAKKHKTPSGKSMGGADSKDKEGADEESSGGEEATKEEASPAPKASADAAEEKPSDAEPVARKAPAKRASADEGASDEGTGAPSALDLVVGGGAMFRQLAYNQDLSRMLAPYTLAPGPEARVGVELYPAAFATSGFAANLGLIAQIGYGFGVKSKATTGAQLTTKFSDFLVGAKVRIPLGMAVPYVSGAYAAQSFELDGQNAGTGAPVPSVAYKMIRIGAGVKFQITPALDADVGGAFLLLTDAGQFRSLYYPHMTGNGGEGSGSLGFRLTGAIGIRAGVDFRQYGLAYHWKAGEPYQAGGAVDRMIVAWGGLQVVLDGVGGEGSTSEAPRAAKKPASDSEGEGADGAEKPKKRKAESGSSDDAAE